MLPGVRDEGTGDSEGHATCVADIGFLARVPALVVHQRARLSETLPTFTTFVRLFPAVCPVWRDETALYIVPHRKMSK